MFAQKLEKFVADNNLPVEKTQELVQLFNDSLVEIGEYIINSTDKKNKNTNSIPSTKQRIGSNNQKWASKVAQAFAEEKELTLDDFPGIEKVTKAHMLEYIKNQPRTNKSPPNKQPSKINKSTTLDTSPVSSSISSTPKVGKGKKVTCAGITEKGDVCTRTGTVTPDGAKKCYCFRHADKWRDFEEVISSDSDEELEQEPPTPHPTPLHTQQTKDEEDEEDEEVEQLPISQQSSFKEESDDELVVDD